jgi:hypothetical protein
MAAPRRRNTPYSPYFITASNISGEKYPAMQNRMDIGIKVEDVGQGCPTHTSSPSTRLQHLRLVHPCDGEAFHRTGQIFADFK